MNERSPDRVDAADPERTRRDRRAAVEENIKALRFTSTEGEYPFDARRSGDGWDLLDCEYDEEGYALRGTDYVQHVSSLEDAIEGRLAGFPTMVDVVVEGVTEREFLDWVRPLLVEQDVLHVNGLDFPVDLDS